MPRQRENDVAPLGVLVKGTQVKFLFAAVIQHDLIQQTGIRFFKLLKGNGDIVSDFLILPDGFEAGLILSFQQLPQVFRAAVFQIGLNFREGNV